MPVKRYTLNGRNIQSLDDFYDQISAKLSLSAHFGRNLDALWDVLTTDIEGPFEIFWKEADASKKALGKDFDRVLKMLKKIDDERGDFKLKIEK